MAETYIKGLSCSKSPATRQGSAAALRVLPCQLLMPCWREAISALGQACQVCCLMALCPADHCCSTSPTGIFVNPTMLRTIVFWLEDSDAPTLLREPHELLAGFECILALLVSIVTSC